MSSSLEEKLQRVDELNDAVADSSERVDKLTRAVEMMVERQSKSEMQLQTNDRTMQTLQSTITALMSIVRDRLPSFDDIMTPIRNPEKQPVQARVIKTKSVEFMPFTLSFFLTISAIMWFAYGLFLHDICIAIPNVVGFILGLVQMVLYGVYRNSGEKLDIEKNVNNSSEQQLKTIVVMNPSGVSEVHPVDVTVMEPVIPLSYTVVHHEDPSKFSKEEEPLTEAGQGHVETAGSRI